MRARSIFTWEKEHDDGNLPQAGASGECSRCISSLDENDVARVKTNERTTGFTFVFREDGRDGHVVQRGDGSFFSFFVAGFVGRYGFGCRCRLVHVDERCHGCGLFARRFENSREHVLLVRLNHHDLLLGLK